MASSRAGGEQEFDEEKYRQTLENCLSELYNSINSVLDMRVRCAEMELLLATMYNPEFRAKLKICQEAAQKCEQCNSNN